MTQSCGRYLSVRAVVLWLAVGVLLVNVIELTSISLMRGLNFDESLALYAGWLGVQRIPANPAFLMPITAVEGVMAGIILDPELLFQTLRALVLVTVLAAMAWVGVVLRLGLPLCLIWAVLTLASSAFASHGIEFRYDWAILVAWLAAFGLLNSRGRSRFIGLGLLIGWLAAHHLKGAYYGAALYGICLIELSLRNGQGDVRRQFVHLTVATISMFCGWVILAYA